MGVGVGEGGADVMGGRKPLDPLEKACNRTKVKRFDIYLTYGYVEATVVLWLLWLLDEDEVGTAPLPLSNPISANFRRVI